MNLWPYAPIFGRRSSTAMKRTLRAVEFVSMPARRRGGSGEGGGADRDPTEVEGADPPEYDIALYLLALGK